MADNAKQIVLRRASGTPLLTEVELAELLESNLPKADRVRVRLTFHAPVTDPLLLTTSEAWDLADALGKAAALGTQEETKRIPRAVFDRAHANDKGGGPR